MQQGGQGLVDEEADAHIQQPLAQGKGNVEHHQAVQQRIAGRDVGDGAHDGLIHPDDARHGQTVEDLVGRVHHKIVGRQAHQRHQHGAQQGAPQGRFAALMPPVHKARHQHEHAAQQEVAELTYAGAGAEGQVQQILHQLDHHAVHRSQREGTQQGRQIRQVQLYEGGDQGDGKLDELEDKGHGAQHGGHGNVMGLLLLSHKKYSLLM